jgi:hypothetical protein
MIKIRKRSLNLFLTINRFKLFKSRAINQIWLFADPGCLSRIPDLKTATREKGEKFVILPLL